MFTKVKLATRAARVKPGLTESASTVAAAYRPRPAVRVGRLPVSNRLAAAVQFWLPNVGGHRKQPLAIFWASGWSTSELDLQRHRRGSPRSRQRLFAGGKRRLNDRSGRTAASERGELAVPTQCRRSCGPIDRLEADVRAFRRCVLAVLARHRPQPSRSTLRDGACESWCLR